MNTTEDDKNFPEKNSEGLEHTKKIFDFTYHKLHHMIDQMWQWSPGDAEILVLNNMMIFLGYMRSFTTMDCWMNLMESQNRLLF